MNLLQTKFQKETNFDTNEILTGDRNNEYINWLESKLLIGESKKSPLKKSIKQTIPKKAMALQGYYMTSDYAKLVNLSKQAISKSDHIYHPIEQVGRKWYKYDNGELAREKYGSVDKHLKKFLPFGFKERSHSVIQNNAAAIDIRKISEDVIEFLFMDGMGALRVLVNPNQIEII